MDGRTRKSDRVVGIFQHAASSVYENTLLQQTASLTWTLFAWRHN